MTSINDLPPEALREIISIMLKAKQNECENRPTPPARAVLVTTAHRGVFFGYAGDTSGNTIKLSQARNCVYWSSEVRGFLGLCSIGPTKSCRIGPPADIELRDITCVAEVEPSAVQAWEAAPWAS